jgi:2-methylisocitrate lyase-like PEP mutase family enzyme
MNNVLQAYQLSTIEPKQLSTFDFSVVIFGSTGHNQVTNQLETQVQSVYSDGLSKFFQS